MDFIPKLVVKTAGRREVIFIIFGAPSCIWLLSLYIPGEQIEESTQAEAGIWYYNVH